MKLSHLSLAVISAISLAACGSSNNNAVDNTVVPKPETEQKPQVDDNKIADPTGLDAVTKANFEQNSSTGFFHRVRGDKSKFNRVANPNNDKPKDATTIASLEPESHLKNIVLANIRGEQNKIVAHYAGQKSTEDTLQEVNKDNVLIPNNNGLTKANQVAGASDIVDQITEVDKFIKHYEDAPSLTAAQQNTLQKLQAAKAELEQLQADVEANETYGQGFYLLANNDSLKWGDGDW